MASKGPNFLFSRLLEEKAFPRSVTAFNMPPRQRRRLNRSQFIDDEAGEDTRDDSPPPASAVLTFSPPSTSESPTRPLNLSAFGGRSSSSPGTKFRVSIKAMNKRGLVVVRYVDGRGNDYSEIVNKVTRSAQDENGYLVTVTRPRNRNNQIQVKR